MNLFAVWFHVSSEGSCLEGVFTTVEKAREQLERSRKAWNSTYGQWVQSSPDYWQKADLTIEITPFELDKGKYL